MPHIIHPAGEVVISMRPVSVFAKGPGSEIEQLRAELQGRWRQAARAVMVLLSLRGLAPSQIAELLDCHPATVRRWIGRFNMAADVSDCQPRTWEVIPVPASPGQVLV